MGVRNILFLPMYGCCMGVRMGEAFFNGILTERPPSGVSPDNGLEFRSDNSEKEYRIKAHGYRNRKNGPLIPFLCAFPVSSYYLSP